MILYECRYSTKEVRKSSKLLMIVRIYLPVRKVSEAHTGERLPVKQREDSSILSRNAYCGELVGKPDGLISHPDASSILAPATISDNSITAIMPSFQVGYVGSIPTCRSGQLPVLRGVKNWMRWIMQWVSKRPFTSL